MRQKKISMKCTWFVPSCIMHVWCLSTFVEMNFLVTIQLGKLLIFRSGNPVDTKLYRNELKGEEDDGDGSDIEVVSMYVCSPLSVWIFPFFVANHVFTFLRPPVVKLCAGRLTTNKSPSKFVGFGCCNSLVLTSLLQSKSSCHFVRQWIWRSSVRGFVCIPLFVHW